MTYNGKCPRCDKELTDNEYGPKCDYCVGYEDGASQFYLDICAYVNKRVKLYNRETSDCHAQNELLKTAEHSKKILDELEEI